MNRSRQASTVALRASAIDKAVADKLADRTEAGRLFA